MAYLKADWRQVDHPPLPPFPLNINIDNYIYEYTPTKSSKGGTLLYIDKSLKYKLRKDLNLNKPKEIESTFVEIIETKKKNAIIGCIYKHPNVSIKEFLNDFLQPFLMKLSFEKRDYVNRIFWYKPL